MSTHDKLSALRDDAVAAWRSAIELSLDQNWHGKRLVFGITEKPQVDLAILGAVQAQTAYTLACAMCTTCGHRTIEHSKNAGCPCCMRTGQWMASIDDRAPN